VSRGSIPVYFGDDDVHQHLPCSECVLDVKQFKSVEALAAGAYTRPLFIST